MATLEGLQFEMERRVILFKPTTTMPDLSPLGYNEDPNLIVSPSTPGETLIYNCPNGTRYLNTDASGNTITEWFKKSQPNGWLPLGSGSGSIYGTDSSTWQLDLSNSGVILQSDGSSNLIIKDPDGDLGTLIVGNLTIGNVTGYLRAIDGSVFADPSIGMLLAGTGILEGDGITKDFEIDHNINSLNHTVSIYDDNNELVYPEIVIGSNKDFIYFFRAPENGEDHRAVILGF
jgi:hypothetical protein